MDMEQRMIAAHKNGMERFDRYPDWPLNVVTKEARAWYRFTDEQAAFVAGYCGARACLAVNAERMVLRHQRGDVT